MRSSSSPSPVSSLLTIAVSSRALFNFEEENKIFQAYGEERYRQTQYERLDIPAPSGIAYPMVKKLLAFNSPEEHLVDVVVLSRNDPTTGLRVFRSIREKGLDIRRGCFTRGNPSLPYLSAFGAHLFLSACAADVRAALDNNIAAAHVLGGRRGNADVDDVLRIAFDGDAVLFSDEAERLYQEEGLAQFTQQEQTMAKKPLQAGPLKPFFDALWQLRQKLPPGKIRTALITARGAPAHERPIRTLMEWKVEVDEAFFLGGKAKQEILRSFQPDFFFDDQATHLESVIGGGHVDYGIINDRNDK